MATVTLDHMIDALTDSEAEATFQRVKWDHGLWARPLQRLPVDEWDVLGLVSGRGGGKTYAGTLAVCAWARATPGGRCALVARTAADVRDVLILGESGILALSPPWFRPRYVPTKRLLAWPNGFEALAFSAEEPDALRGPQFHFAWGDEFAAWRPRTDRGAGDVWSNLQDAVRLGRPRIVLTTTPRPTLACLDAFLGPRDDRGRRPVSADTAKGREWSFVTTSASRAGHEVQHRTVVRRWPSEDNALNLASGFVEKRRAKYAGSRLGAQELAAEFLMQNDSALWTAEIIDAHRLPAIDSERERLVVAIDPTRSEFLARDEAGIVVACRCKNQHAYILEDGSMRGSPFDWATRALALARTYNADGIVIEQNRLDQGVRDTLRTVAGADAFKWLPKTASADKKARAEPVSALYRAGRVHHVNREGETFEFLEDEMVTWEPQSKVSPNRLDALVWAISDLLLGPEKAPALIAAPISIRKPWNAGRP